MSTVTVPIGLVLAVQGAGGLINNLVADSRSWFLLNYVEMPSWLRLAAHTLMFLAGLGLVIHGKGWRWLVED